MKQFSSEREAKEYLVSKIVEEAQREGVALSEIERKMLYFSESGWTLPDIMEVNEEFEREYDSDVYERKIAKLSHRIVKRIRKEQPEEYKAWTEAVRLLSKGDHYLLVMVGQAGGPPLVGQAEGRPPGDLWKLWGIGFAIVAAFVGVTLVLVEHNVDPTKYVAAPGFLLSVIWVALVCAGGAYVLLRLVLGARVDQIAGRLLEWMLSKRGR